MNELTEEELWNAFHEKGLIHGKVNKCSDIWITNFGVFYKYEDKYYDRNGNIASQEDIDRLIKERKE